MSHLLNKEYKNIDEIRESIKTLKGFIHTYRNESSSVSIKYNTKTSKLEVLKNGKPIKDITELTMNISKSFLSDGFKDTQNNKTITPNQYKDEIIRTMKNNKSLYKSEGINVSDYKEYDGGYKVIDFSSDKSNKYGRNSETR